MDSGTNAARARGIRRAVTDIERFSHLLLPGFALRPYQLEPARAVTRSVEQRLGLQFAIVFSRQAGKDELLAQVLAYLLNRYQTRGGNIVIAAPTYRPQALLSRDRLVRRLDNVLTGRTSARREGYTVTLGKASARFLSASPNANARGQTADLLLVANEAQDIQPAVWDSVFDPMAASTDATTLFMGTVWNRETLLARQMRHLEELEQHDGIKRVWRVPWEEVARDLPAYGRRVRARIAQFGPTHPFIRTEYCLEELDDNGGLFPEHRIAMLRGEHERQHAGERGRRYALLLDVAGEEESGAGPNMFASQSRRDSTALTVVEIVLDEHARRARPHYRVVDRRAWTGVRHTELHDTITHLARTVWRASHVVVDATGIGAGLASFLTDALRARGGGEGGITVTPFVFTLTSKSQLGWDLVALIDGGRLQEYRDDSLTLSPEGRVSAQFWQQMRSTTYEILPGPGKLMRWHVPSSRGHDDLVMSLALVAELDRVDWRPRVAVGM